MKRALPLEDLQKKNRHPPGLVIMVRNGRVPPDLRVRDASPSNDDGRVASASDVGTHVRQDGWMRTREPAQCAACRDTPHAIFELGTAF